MEELEPLARLGHLGSLLAALIGAVVLLMNALARFQRTKNAVHVDAKLDRLGKSLEERNERSFETMTRHLDQRLDSKVEGIRGHLDGLKEMWSTTVGHLGREIRELRDEVKDRFDEVKDRFTVADRRLDRLEQIADGLRELQALKDNVRIQQQRIDILTLQAEERKKP